MRRGQAGPIGAGIVSVWRGYRAQGGGGGGLCLKEMVRSNCRGAVAVASQEKCVCVGGGAVIINSHSEL